MVNRLPLTYSHVPTLAVADFMTGRFDRIEDAFEEFPGRVIAGFTTA